MVIPPLVSTMVFVVFYLQNRTDVSRGEDFRLMTEDQLAVNYKCFVVEDDPRQKLKEFVGPSFCPFVAKKTIFNRRSGFRFFERGHNVSFTAEIPEFLVESPFLKQLGHQLRDE
jgi:hypothetical protein